MPNRIKWNMAIGLFVIIISLFSVYPTIRWETLSPEKQAELNQKWEDNDSYYKEKDAFAKTGYFFSKWLEGSKQLAINMGLDLRGGMHLVFQIDTSKLSSKAKKDVTKKVKAVIERRINQFGVAEPAIYPQGADQIVVQLPGVVDRERAVNLIGKTALLEFCLVNPDPAALKRAIAGKPVEGYEVKQLKRESLSQPILIKKQAELTGANLVGAMVGVGQSFNEPQVEIEFDAKGAKIFAAVTREYIGRQLAIVLDDQVLTAPVIKTEIPNGKGVITGQFTQEEATDLATILTAGALPAPLSLIEDRSVSPSLGRDSIRKGTFSALLGLFVVLIFMLFYYRFSGLLSDFALVMNLIITVAALSWFGGTLTLPGIAGIALALGMAVDANVLINERIREEIGLGKKIRTAIFAGYDRAFSAIIDSNITTIIAASMLFMFGTGPVRGFALTLTIGICASMYTAIVGTRTIFEVVGLNRKFTKVSMVKVLSGTNIDFLKLRKFGLIFSVVALAVGISTWVSRGQNNFGVDFSGGTLAEIRFAKSVSMDDIRSCLKKAGLEETNIQKVANGDEILIRTKTTEDFMEPLQAQFPDNKIELLRREQVGAIVGADLQRKTFLAGFFSLLLILLYIGIRFEFKFAVGAVIALMHDTLFTLGALALSGREMSLTVVAGVLTIIGYSLNDTIVVYDRIRENLKLMRKVTFREIVNASLNQTLGRTILTSVTTLIVVLSLFLFGGEVINDFAFTLMIGVLIGTYSSIFVAVPLVYLWHKKNGAQEAKAAKGKKK